ncbi:MAG: hypothetical protein ACI81L_001514 [Verrucomicrobiales bacterium]
MGFPEEIHDQVRRISPVVLAAEQILPVPEIFHTLLPGGGLQRGWTTLVDGGPSARALAWALLGGVTTAGGWIATVDVPGISLAAAREVGVAIERVLVVTSSNPDTWSASIGALIGSVDAIVLGSPLHRVQPSEYRRMASRCRERGTVLVELTPDPALRQSRQRERQLQYDVSFMAEPVEWQGLGFGHGCLQARSLDVSVSGRRTPGAGRHARFELPAIDGELRRIELLRPELVAIP